MSTDIDLAQAVTLLGCLLLLVKPLGTLHGQGLPGGADLPVARPCSPARSCFTASAG